MEICITKNLHQELVVFERIKGKFSVNVIITLYIDTFEAFSILWSYINWVEIH